MFSGMRTCSGSELSFDKWPERVNSSRQLCLEAPVRRKLASRSERIDLVVQLVPELPNSSRSPAVHAFAILVPGPPRIVGYR